MRAPPLLLLTAAATLAAATAAAAAACDFAGVASDCSAVRCDSCPECGQLRAADAAALCARPPAQRALALAALRLPNCCERAAADALDERARSAAAAGGAACRAALGELLAADALAAAVSCRFADVISRFDCRQPFSVIHDCRACEQSYRRWVCSALLPYYWGGRATASGGAEEAEVPPRQPPRRRRRDALPRAFLTHPHHRNRTRTHGPFANLSADSDSFNYLASDFVQYDYLFSEYYGANPNRKSEKMHARALATASRRAATLAQVTSWRAARSRAAPAPSGRGRWRRAAGSGPGRPPYPMEPIRVRPCMAICQEVEQRCPYFLPGDRAPSYPTQYAGEPTFLCSDPNIPVTGEQEKNANHGQDNCCYWYCGDGVCTKCNPEYWDMAVDNAPTADFCEGAQPPTVACSMPSMTSSASRTSSCAYLIIFCWLLHVHLCRRNRKHTAATHANKPTNHFWSCGHQNVSCTDSEENRYSSLDYNCRIELANSNLFFETPVENLTPRHRIRFELFKRNFSKIKHSLRRDNIEMFEQEKTSPHNTFQSYKAKKRRSWNIMLKKYYSLLRHSKHLFEMYPEIFPPRHRKKITYIKNVTQFGKLSCLTTLNLSRSIVECRHVQWQQCAYAHIQNQSAGLYRLKNHSDILNDYFPNKCPCDRSIRWRPSRTRLKIIHFINLRVVIEASRHFNNFSITNSPRAASRSRCNNSIRTSRSSCRGNIEVFTPCRWHKLSNQHRGKCKGCRDRLRQRYSMESGQSRCRNLWEFFSGNRVKSRSGSRISRRPFNKSISRDSNVTVSRHQPRRRSHHFSGICQWRRTSFNIRSGYCNYIRLYRVREYAYLTTTDMLLFNMRHFHKANL